MNVERKVFIGVLKTLKVYADKHKLKIYGFSDDFSEVVFVRLETSETVRVSYTQVKLEVEQAHGA